MEERRTVQSNLEAPLPGLASLRVFLENPSPSCLFSDRQIPTHHSVPLPGAGELGFKSKLYFFIYSTCKPDSEPLKGKNYILFFFEPPVPITVPGTEGVLNKHLMNE